MVLSCATPVLAEEGPAVPSSSGSSLLQNDTAAQRFSLGLGYPDVRARVALAHGWDLEGKFAFEQGIQVYSGRVYWHCLDFGPVDVDLGGEGGWGQFDDIDSLSGGGPVYGAFLGLEYPFARRFKLSVDAGPYRVQAKSEGYSYQTTQLVFNTALYIFVF